MQLQQYSKSNIGLYHILATTWHNNSILGQKVGSCVVISPNSTFPNKFRVKDLSHKDVGSALHVEPRPNLQFSGTLSDKLDLLFETVLFDDLDDIESDSESLICGKDLVLNLHHLLSAGCHGQELFAGCYRINTLRGGHH